MEFDPFRPSINLNIFPPPTLPKKKNSVFQSEAKTFLIFSEMRFFVDKKNHFAFFSKRPNDSISAFEKSRSQDGGKAHYPEKNSTRNYART